MFLRLFNSLAFSRFTHLSFSCLNTCLGTLGNAIRKFCISTTSPILPVFDITIISCSLLYPYFHFLDLLRRLIVVFLTGSITSTKSWVASDERIATTAAIEAQLLPYAFPEAPVDGLEYARKNAAWSEVPGFPEAPTDGRQYGRQSSTWTVIDTAADGVPEAPENGTIYGRKNAAWVEVPTGGGGGGGGQVNTVVAGDNITVDSNDAINPKVSVTANSFIQYNISTLAYLP